MINTLLAIFGESTSEYRLVAEYLAKKLEGLTNDIDFLQASIVELSSQESTDIFGCVKAVDRNIPITESCQIAIRDCLEELSIKIKQRDSLLERAKSKAACFVSELTDEYELTANEVCSVLCERLSEVTSSCVKLEQEENIKKFIRK